MISQVAMKKKRQAQVEMFGCEPDIGGAVQRRADAPLKPAMPQEPCDAGLFGDDANQTDLIEALRKG